jgi:hypothetical protein
MIKEILKNIIRKKPVVPFPGGFNVTPEQAAKIIDFQKKIDTIFGRSLRIRQVDVHATPVNGTARPYESHLRYPAVRHRFWICHGMPMCW